MTASAVIYVVASILGALGRFFLHWYTNGSRLFWHAVLDFFSELERMISFRVIAVNWYRPLYQDYSKIGMLVGIPIRLMRIVLSAVLYLFLMSTFLAGYLAYLCLPVFLLSRLV